MKNNTKIYIIICAVLFITILIIIAPIVVTKADLTPLWLINDTEETEATPFSLQFTQKEYTDTNPLSKEELEEYASKRLAQLEEDKERIIAEGSDEDEMNEYIY